MPVKHEDIQKLDGAVAQFLPNPEDRLNLYMKLIWLGLTNKSFNETMRRLKIYVEAPAQLTEMRYGRNSR